MQVNKRIFLLIFITLAVLVFLPLWGITGLKWPWSVSGGESSFILFQLRLPRVFLGYLAGGILAMSGLVSQNLFRNSLATPDVLGVTTGTAAGTILAIKLGVRNSFFGMGGIFIFGIAGALASVFLILWIVRLIRNQSVFTLLMTGVAVNLFFSAAIVLMQYLFDYSNTLIVLRWLMGGLSVSYYRDVVILALCMMVGIGLIIIFRRELILLSTQDEFILSKGMNVQRFRMRAFVMLSLVVALSVSITGPIGFIALVIPHIGRTLGCNRFLPTMWIVVLLGGIVLAVADFIGRIIMPPVEIPVGAITSFFGAPFFLYILVRSLKNRQLGR